MEVQNNVSSSGYSGAEPTLPPSNNKNLNAMYVTKYVNDTNEVKYNSHALPSVINHVKHFFLNNLLFVHVQGFIIFNCSASMVGSLVVVVSSLAPTSVSSKIGCCF